MAIGDIFSGISSPDTVIVLQPASSVVICITWTNGSPTGSGMSLYDGSNSSYSDTFANLDGGQLSMKMFITNSKYLSIAGQGGASRSGYTGIQIS
mgnify:CR=1 FL=1